MTDAAVVSVDSEDANPMVDTSALVGAADGQEMVGAMHAKEARHTTTTARTSARVSEPGLAQHAGTPALGAICMPHRNRRRAAWVAHRSPTGGRHGHRRVLSPLSDASRNVQNLP